MNICFGKTIACVTLFTVNFFLWETIYELRIETNENEERDKKHNQPKTVNFNAFAQTSSSYVLFLHRHDITSMKRPKSGARFDLIA